jgi:hypothetical protein
MTTSDDTGFDAQFDAYQTRNDAERAFREPLTIEQRIDNCRRMIAFYEREIKGEDWELWPEPERTREWMRGNIKMHQEELAGLTTPVLAPVKPADLNKTVSEIMAYYVDGSV